MTPAALACRLGQGWTRSALQSPPDQAASRWRRAWAPRAYFVGLVGVEREAAARVCVFCIRAAGRCRPASPFSGRSRWTSQPLCCQRARAFFDPRMDVPPLGVMAPACRGTMRSQPSGDVRVSQTRPLPAVQADAWSSQPRPVRAVRSTSEPLLPKRSQGMERSPLRI
jgi:hypothetical protein